MMLDLGHLELASQSLGSIRKRSSIESRQVLAVHVHENNGRADEHAESKRKPPVSGSSGQGCFSNAKVVTESRGLGIDRIAAQVRLLEKTLESSRR